MYLTSERHIFSWKESRSSLLTDVSLDVRNQRYRNQQICKHIYTNWSKINFLSIYVFTYVTKWNLVVINYYYGISCMRKESTSFRPRFMIGLPSSTFLVTFETHVNRGYVVNQSVVLPGNFIKKTGIKRGSVLIYSWLYKVGFRYVYVLTGSIY